MAYMNDRPLGDRAPLVAAVDPVVAEALRSLLTAALENALRG